MNDLPENTETTAITTEDVATVLAQSGMLVTFHSSAWSGEVTDHKVVENAKAQAGAKGKVGRFQKNLLANNDAALIDVNSAISAAYRDHVRMTLPWGNSKQRLLANAGFMDYAKMIQSHKNTIQEKKAILATVYNGAVAQAQRDLGGMANAAQYPGLDQVMRRFMIDVDFEPVPATATFPGLPNELGAALQRRVQAKMLERARSAIDDMWKQAAILLNRFADQLRPDGRIHDTTLEQVNELPKRLRTFNVVGDPKVNAFAAIVERDVGRQDKKALERDNYRALVLQAVLKAVAMVPAR